MMIEKYLKYIFFLFCLIFPACIIFTRILPFIDLPFRLMASTILRYYDSPEYLFSQYYTIPTLFKSNVFHLIFCSLKIFPDVEIANKIYYIIYFVSFPLLLYFLIKKLGGNKWFSLLGFFIVFNSDVHWGFADYTMSLSALLIFIMVLNYSMQKKNITGTLLCPVIILATFFIHFQMAIYESVLLVIVSFVIFKMNIKKISLYILSIIPVWIIMGLVYMIDANRGNENLLSYLVNYYINVYPAEIIIRLRNLFIINNLHIGYETEGVIAGISVSVIIIVPVIYFLIKRKLKCNMRDLPEVVMISSLVFYFILPDIIPGQNLISSRFAEIFFIGLILFLSKAEMTFSEFRKFIIPVTAFLVIFFVISFEYFAGFNKVTEGFDKSLFKDTGEKEVLTSLIDNKMYRDRPVFIHFHNYYTVWTKNISTGLIDYRYGAVRRNIGKNILPDFDPWSNFSEYPDKRYLDAGYILLKSRNDFSGNDFKLINSSGEWKLYKRSY